jgi:hypothetical protein
MEDLLIFAAGAVGLALFEVLAVFLGHDSRDGFGDSYPATRFPGHHSSWF